MIEESKIAIVSHGAVVEFNPNSAEHRKILESANRKLITNELYQRDFKCFKELVLFYQSAVNNETIDDKIEEFLRATGISLNYSDLAVFNYGYPDVDGYFTTLYNRAKGIKPPSASAHENPIVELKEKCLNPQHSSTHAGGGLLYDILLRKFNRFMQNITSDLLSLGNVKSLTTRCRIETNILRKIEGFNKETNLGLDREIVLGCPIDENLQTGYFNVLFVDLIKRSEEFRIQTIPLSEKIGFIQPKYGKDQEVKADPNIRFWYDKFGVSHEIPPNKPMEAGSVKQNETYGLVYQSSINGGPIPSPNPRDESVRSKDIVIKNSISISAGKVNVNALEAACRTMPESMKGMHRKVVSEELYDRFADALGSAYLRHRHLRGTASREFLYGDIICIEQFKREFGNIFSIEDMNLFLNGVITIPELLCKYVRRPYPGEKKIKRRTEYDLCLSLLVSLLSLFNPNRMDRASVERAKRLGEELNVRFDINITEGDFLDILYRRAAPSHVLKKYATAEVIKGK